MRNKQHYLRMMRNNPNATIGISLAASAVYAARYGQCEAENHSTEEWKAIHRDLATRYGSDGLSADDVVSEMG